MAIKLPDVNLPHARFVFHQMDRDNDGVVSEQEFVDLWQEYDCVEKIPGWEEPTKIPSTLERRR